MRYTRRKFIKEASLATAAPWLALSGYGEGRLCTPRWDAENMHTILCCNIRVDLPEDEEKGFGWQSRKAICAQIIAAHHPSIICLQEVLKGQMEDLQKAFPDFMGFGFEGPEMDVRPVGYHGIAKNPILFSRERYELVGGGCYWLSETPLKPGSVSWNTARARHANFVRLKDRNTKKQFRVINLHLDHKSQEAREKQIELVLEEAQQYPADFPQVLAGDFNSSMATLVYELVKERGWVDSHTVIHGEAEAGYTVHMFQGERYNRKDQGRKIDFIFSRGAINTIDAGIIRDHIGGRYPSDHYFISARLLIE